MNWKLPLIWIKVYVLNLIYVSDLVLNTILFGDPDETVSSRIGKKVRDGRKCAVCDFICKILDKIDPRHCDKAIKSHEGRGSYDDDSVFGRKS